MLVNITQSRWGCVSEVELITVWVIGGTQARAACPDKQVCWMCRSELAAAL